VLSENTVDEYGVRWVVRTNGREAVRAAPRGFRTAHVQTRRGLWICLVPAGMRRADFITIIGNRFNGLVLSKGWRFSLYYG